MYVAEVLIGRTNHDFSNSGLNSPFRRMHTRLSKIFETFDIRSDLNFSNTQNSRSEHI